ncbi:MAG: hypothetical protein KDK56_09865 [Simkania sp.]|nr:hypothetical protein [Simkania sp.]
MNFVVTDRVWNGIQVISPNHSGNIELLLLSKRVDRQFKQKGCPFEESKALKNLCERITNWYNETSPESVKYVTGISDIRELVTMFGKMESEFEGLTEEEAIQLLVERGIFDEKKLPVFLKDYENSLIYECDYFEVNDDPSLWYTQAAWEYQFPGVEMPSSSKTINFIYNGKEYAFFSIFERSQIEAAKTQMMTLNHLNT